MDPLSITVASLSIAKMCGVVGFELAKFVHDGAHIGLEIGALQSDVKGLETVLGLLHDTVNNADLKVWLEATGPIRRYWNSLSVSLGDAKGVLIALSETVTRINAPAKFMETTRKQVRLKLAADEVAAYRQQISGFKDTVQVILNTTAIWHQVSDKNVAVQVLPRLDETQDMIRRLGLHFNERIVALQTQLSKQSSTNPFASEPGDEEGNADSGVNVKVTGNKAQYAAFRNLKECLKGAATVITSASTIVNRQDRDDTSTVYDSDFGDVFSDAPSSDTLDWIKNNTITESDESYVTYSEIHHGKNLHRFDEAELLGEPDLDLELELEILEACLEQGKQCIKMESWADAERHLRNCIDDQDALKGLQGTEQIQHKLALDAITALIPVLERTDKWPEVEAMLRKKLQLQSRSQSQDKKTQLADKLLLSRAMLRCDQAAEALLYCRSAEAEYRKLGHEGVEGRLKALEVMAEIHEKTGRIRDAERCKVLLQYLSKPGASSHVVPESTDTGVFADDSFKANPEIAEALRTYNPMAKGYLAFAKGDKIQIVKRADGAYSWWTGRIGSAEGQFPGI